MRLPEIQDRLKKIAREISKLSREMSRRSSGPRVRTNHAKMTPGLRKEIIAFQRALDSEGKKMSQIDIAKIFNVNPGRVSEALKGYRQ